MSVAKKIAVSFPEHALLRRHAPPLQRRMDEFIRLTEKLGYPIDGTSGATLHASFQQIDDPRIAEVLKVLAIKPMQRAKYYCTGSLDITQYHHFALNAPLYTHFTSPIRRYADVIVHRLLLSALKGEKQFYLPTNMVQDIALRCNTCKEQAKSAQEQSSHLYLATCLHRLITQRGGPIRTEAVIIDVMDQSVRLLSPEYGIEQRVYIDKLPLERSTWDEQRGQHTVHWRDNVTIADVLTTSAQANEESESESDTENEEEEELHEIVSVSDVIETPLAAAADTTTAEASTTEAPVVDAPTANTASAENTVPPTVSDKVDAAPHNAEEPPPVNDASPAANESTSPAAKPVKDRAQVLRVFERVPIAITVNVEKSPPIIHVALCSPFL